MPLEILPADLQSDRAGIVEVIRRNLTSTSDQRRFDWLYRQSPHGEGIAWVARESTDGAIVGLAAIFPRRLCFKGEEIVSCVLGDFCFDEKYRSLGPALELQRICLTAATSAPFALYYDFPSTRMMMVYKRIGIGQTGSITRWARPIRIDRQLEAKIGSRGLARAVGAVVGVGLSLRGWKGREAACDLALQSGPCGEEFTALDQQNQSRSGGLRTVRSAEYLNWRYLAHPMTRFQILTARRKGTLVGFAAFGVEGNYASVADISALGDDPAIVARLLAGVVGAVKSTAAAVSMVTGDKHPWSDVFHKAGFRPRETSPLLAHANSGALASSTVSDWNWYLMQGERDS